MRANRNLFTTLLPLIGVIAVALSVACAGPSAATPPAAPLTNTPVPATATPLAAAAAPTATPAPAPPSGDINTRIADFPTPTPAADTPTLIPSPTPEPEPDGAGTPPVFTLTEGSIARYKVEEVLARTGFKVATGETEAVAGQVVFDADGGIAADASRIAVQAATLRTDSDRRDGYVRNRTLQTDIYPEVVFIPQSIDWQDPPPGELRGTQDFTITGDLTVKDQTRTVTWDATAEFNDDGSVTGFASVQFTFDDFGMDKPSVAVVLSVEDEILLELDFVGTMSPR